MKKPIITYPNDGQLKALEQRINHKFKDISLLRLALVHKSSGEGKEGFSSNERLEWLGDRVLGLICAEYFYKFHPSLEEGALTNLYNDVVSGTNCARVAKEIGLDNLIIVSKSISQNSGINASILSDAFEAVIGAIYSDAGLDAVRPMIELALETANKHKNIVKNYKSHLQEWLQKRGFAAPIYSIVSKTGPDHAPEFEISLSAMGKSVSAHGNSKQATEQKCAQIFIENEIDRK